MQNYLKPEEVAQQLQVGTAEILSLIEAGKLRAIRIGSNIRIPETGLDELAMTCAAGPVVPDAGLENTRLVNTRTGKATFRVRGCILDDVEIWPGKMRYPIKFPKAFWEELLAHFQEGEVAVGGSFDGPERGSLGEFIQQKIKTKMNPAVYVAALLSDEGYADASRRGYIRFRSKKERRQAAKL